MQRTRYPERRRTTRLSLQIPLTVRCRLPEGETIDLKASTYVVSAHGALVLMDTPLIPGQTVKVFNDHTAHSVDCVVSNGLFNLSAEKEAIFAEIERVLKPGGRTVNAEIVLRAEPTQAERESQEDWFT